MTGQEGAPVRRARRISTATGMSESMTMGTHSARPGTYYTPYSIGVDSHT